jgi:hypothetical protein
MADAIKNLVSDAKPTGSKPAEPIIEPISTTTNTQANTPVTEPVEPTQATAASTLGQSVPALVPPRAPVAATADAQSTSEEEAAIAAQIEEFIGQKKPESTDAGSSNLSPTVSSVEPAQKTDTLVRPQPTTISPTIQPTVSPATAPPPTPPAPVAAKTTPVPPPERDNDSSDGVAIAHKKVISPITHDTTPQPNLDELLAKEGLDVNFETQTSAPNNGEIVQNNQPAPPPPPVQPVSTSSSLPTTPHPPGHVISPNSGIDPNSISL